MSQINNEAERIRQMRIKARQGRQLLADPTAVGGPAPGRGPSYGNPTIAGGVRAISGSGGVDAFPVPAPAARPPALTSPPPEAAPSPVANPAVRRPATRTVTGASSIGLPDGDIGGEIRRVAQDRGIQAQRLGATYRAAQAAKQRGDIGTYDSLMEAWNSQLQERRDTESYGRNLSLAQPRKFVTPEQAQASADSVPGMVARARAESARRLQAASNSQQDGSYAAGAAAAPGIAAQRFSAPQDQIRQRAMLDFIGQEPTLDSGGNLTTGGAMENAKRRSEYARRMAELNRAPNPAEQVDQADVEGRYGQAMEQAQAAGDRAKVQRESRMKGEMFRRQLRAGELEVALADQERRKSGMDTETLLARAKYESARRGLQDVSSSPQDEIASNTTRVLESFVPYFEYGRAEDGRRQFINQIDTLAVSIPQMSDAEKTKLRAQLKVIADNVEEQGRKGLDATWLGQLGYGASALARGRAPSAEDEYETAKAAADRVRELISRIDASTPATRSQM